ncbi:MAG: sigma-70 family RNA polymerase sigma factor [Bacteroidota bacterium]
MDKQLSAHELTDHFFRHSYAKLVALLVRYFGLSEISLAEDIVQDTLVDAMEQWSLQGLPQNPEGWLLDVAKKKTINSLKRQQFFLKKVVPEFQEMERLEAHFESGAIQHQDNQLRMIFSCCHPILAEESQIALALKTLCGLSISEIAQALLTSKANINKRLYRAKQQFRQGKFDFVLPPATGPSGQDPSRLTGVLKTLYLLFKTGYYSNQRKTSIQIELCFEAVRLQRQVLVTYQTSAVAQSLLAWMLLCIARFPGRQDQAGLLLPLEEQDRTSWDQRLIAEGINLLQLATQSNALNSYLLQAGIAAEHCLAPSFEATNWASIYQQYALLERFEASSIIQFNKAIARFHQGQQQQALIDLQSMKEEPSLKSNLHFQCALGLFLLHQKQTAAAQLHFKQALSLATSDQEKELIRRRISTQK